MQNGSDPIHYTGKYTTKYLKLKKAFKLAIQSLTGILCFHPSGINAVLKSDALQHSICLSIQIKNWNEWIYLKNNVLYNDLILSNSIFR